MNKCTWNKWQRFINASNKLTFPVDFTVHFQFLKPTAQFSLLNIQVKLDNQ